MSVEKSNDSNDDGSFKGQYQGFTEEVAEEIKHLARKTSNLLFNNDSNDASLALNLSGILHIPGVNPFTGIDPRLDPDSERFDSKFWVKNLRQMVESDLDYYKPSTLGVAFKDMRCYGMASESDYQANFLNGIYKIVREVFCNKVIRNDKGQTFDILKPMDGLLRPGELTVVLGRPGAGCSTFLKTIASQTYGFNVDKESLITYDGLTPQEISNHYRGEVIYCAETENHFPQLTVGDTLEFAARMRTPQNRPLGVSREQYAKHLAAVYMATFGLSHTRYTKVGNEYITGVSGGERKRVSIAEAAISQSKLQCWDNSTRGLDSATAFEFIKALKTGAQIQRTTSLVAIYQCSQDTYNLFDKVILLYEGYQIFLGDAGYAKEYFEEMGYECPARQTTADFLTSLTNPSERIVKKGFEHKVPRTPVEFYEYWRMSQTRATLVLEIDEYINSSDVTKFKEGHQAIQSKSLRPKSPHVVSFAMQVKYIIRRCFLRTKADPSIVLFGSIGNSVMALVVSSLFYNLPHDTSSFYFRSSALFFATFFNAFASVLEILTLYEARPIIEKHKTFALYHPAADAVASIIADLPNKFVTGICFNLITYFMVNLKRTSGAFFAYLLFAFTSTITMSHIFRTIGAATKTLYEAMTPAALILNTLILFTGFVIPTPNMLGWCRWINYLDPIAYVFEALMANEFHGQEFECAMYIPSGPGYPTNGTSNGISCSVVGRVLGKSTVNGDRYILESFDYKYSHFWRNWGISIGFMIFFLFTYLVICEYNKGAMQKGDILLFQKDALKKHKLAQNRFKADAEAGNYEKFNEDFENIDLELINPGHKIKNIFHWRNISYQVKINSEERVILNDIDGYVKPGQVTALMGVSGAGKTTLLNALSERLTSGTITSGVRMVNGHELDSLFQRSIGYVQQQDLHLATSTVREALTFSAYLRQPDHATKNQKDEYVDYIIKLLEMEKYSDAVVGVPGEGLNIEQRKRLTIGVELVAKPKLLVFLDEPTSGLDAQTAWSICKLIRKLADHGQAILCTIHQPSAILLQTFDRLLLLQKGGETVYFGDLGEHFSILINYFEKYGAPKCPSNANPAEWMLEVIGATPGSHASQDYFKVWRSSSEYQQLQQELNHMEAELVKLPQDISKEMSRTFAAPLWKQYIMVTQRLFQQYWRTNRFLYSKIAMAVFSALINGFTFFKADKSLQGLQNQKFSVFMILVGLDTIVEQYLPMFISQRDLYEARERPSKTFNWVAFMLAQFTVEIPWDILSGTLAFLCWYYPIGLYNNAVPTNAVHQRGGLVWFLVVLFYTYASSLAHLCISFNEVAENAANLANLMLSTCLVFCGVLVTSESMPRFWIFMYRFNPLTYFVSSLLSTSLANSDLECSNTELVIVHPLDGKSCGEYLGPYNSFAHGTIVNPEATSNCQYCMFSSTNQFLDLIDAIYHHRFRDMGIFIAFIVFDWILALFFYWLTRVPKGNRQKQGTHKPTIEVPLEVPTYEKVKNVGI